MNDGIVRVSIFDPGTLRDTVLQSNGICLDSICTVAEGEEDLAGNFRLECTFINDKNLSNNIKQGSILKVRNEFNEDEIFRITTVESGTMLISIIAFQITITDTQTLWIKDTRPTKTSGQGALTTLYEAADSFGFPKELFVTSDIDTISTAYYMNMNMFKALYDCDQSFINRWGGETLRRQYNLCINQRIGVDNGVSIMEGKNLTGFKATVSYDNLTTVAIGKGYEGILGHYIESPLKDKYPRAYPKEIEYSDVKLRKPSDNDTEGFATMEEAVAELDRRIKLEFSQNHIDEIKATYDINFIQLAQTEEYKNYSYLERVEIGDIVHVKLYSLDIKLTTRVISKKVNYLTSRIIEMKLSNNPVNVEKSDARIIADIRNVLALNNNSSMANYIDAKLKAGLKNSYAVARENEFLVMDSQDINTARSIVRINKNGLGFSRTGYYGRYVYGFTIDGKINASCIQTGILSTVLIQNADGSFQIDLSGSSGASFLNDGKLAMRMENNALNFYNWAKDGDYIGALTALCLDENGKSNPDKPSIGIVNDKDSYFTISYAKNSSDSQFLSYIDFDKYNVLKAKAIAPIKVHEDIEMYGHTLYNPSVKADSWIPFYIGNKLVAYFNGERMTLCVPIYNKNGNLAFDPMAPQGETVDGSDNLRKSVVNSARKLIGKWYVFGGNYPPLGKDSGTDCSGLMQWAYNDNGIKISRTTYTQIKEGTEVSESNLKPGDLVFPSTEHVFMYSGEKDGKHMCVEAAHTGTQLRERAFTWGSGYRARRIIKDSGSSHGGSGSSPGGTAGSKASANIIYYVKGIEGFGPNYYYDSVGVKTLGYGMTGKELNGVSVPMSETSATHHLTENFNRDYYAPVLRIVKGKGVRNPKQREIDAFASFAYNLGVPSFEESTLLKKYAAGERGESIHNEFKRWCHAGGQVSPGLVRRREEEWKIFSGSGAVAGYNGRPYIDIIGKGGSVTANGGYGAAPY
ncbi:MAG: C40 family peptidase [Clostridium baratii]|uniref:phage tail spike protein n=1 Tax=Clostridium baratii TaxID=1561 RepID=UPI00242D4665|nr:phage tail spike protein [Clostridium baratii]MBS6006877.1 C40 family peptidase [Clostridium baratii]